MTAHNVYIKNRCMAKVLKYEGRGYSLARKIICGFEIDAILYWFHLFLTRGLRQMRGNIGEYIIFIIPPYRFFSKLNMFNNISIINNR